MFRSCHTSSYKRASTFRVVILLYVFAVRRCSASSNSGFGRLRTRVKNWNCLRSCRSCVDSWPRLSSPWSLRLWRRLCDPYSESRTHRLITGIERASTSKPVPTLSGWQDRHRHADGDAVSTVFSALLPLQSSATSGGFGSRLRPYGSFLRAWGCSQRGHYAKKASGTQLQRR